MQKVCNVISKHGTIDCGNFGIAPLQEKDKLIYRGLGAYVTGPGPIVEPYKYFIVQYNMGNCTWVNETTYNEELKKAFP